MKITLAASLHSCGLLAAALGAWCFVSASGALAQNSVEFGYKDRIFAQKYLLPQDVTPTEATTLQMRALNALVSRGWSHMDDPKPVEALGGLCDTDLVAFFTGRSANAPNIQTEDQIALNQMANESQASRGLVPPDLCALQTLMFQVAYADSLSMEAQLKSLADATRRRFASQWIAASELKRPGLDVAAQRLKALQIRLERLRKAGAVVSADDLQGVDPTKIWDALVRLSTAEPYATLDARLSALEATTAAAGRRRSDAQYLQQVDERRRGSDAASMVNPTADPLGAMRERMAECAMPGNDYPRSLPAIIVSVSFSPDGTIRAARAVYPQNAAGVEGQAVEMVLHRVRLCGPYPYLTALPYEKWREVELGFQLRPPSPREQAEMAQARATAEASSSAASTEVTQPAFAPPPAAQSACVQGGECTTNDKAVFCRTPQHLTAILSERPGPRRKRVLDTFKASGDCSVLEAQTRLRWNGPEGMIRPIGEPAAATIPVVARGYLRGVVLKDSLAVE